MNFLLPYTYTLGFTLCGLETSLLCHNMNCAAGRLARLLEIEYDITYTLNAAAGGAETVHAVQVELAGTMAGFVEQFFRQ